MGRRGGDVLFFTMWLLLITLSLAGRRAKGMLGSPDIDLFRVIDEESLPDACNGKECPEFTIAEDLSFAGSSVIVRDYMEMDWVSSSQYEATDNMCLEGSEAMISYYKELYDFFKGVNTMGLSMDRTVPIRIIGRVNDEGNIEYCHLMFYIPKMYAVNPPSPLSVHTFVGYNYFKRCYVAPIKGKYSWRKAMKLHKVLQRFLERRDITSVESKDLIFDIYSGYGVPNAKKYSEVMMCETESLTSY